MSTETAWDRTDGPVLRWVHKKPWGFNWEFRRGDEPTEEVPSVSGSEMDEALRRLEEAGLIVGNRLETSGLFVWSRLRPTADGLRVLGEWPPQDEAVLQLALVKMLMRLAEEAPEEQAKWYRRAAGAVGRFGTTVVAEVIKGEMRRAGGELAS